MIQPLLIAFALLVLSFDGDCLRPIEVGIGSDGRNIAMLEFKLLLILVAVNGVPLLLHLLLGDRLSRPLDAGLMLFDGSPLLGYSKTWRGVIAGMIAGIISAFLLGFSLKLGFIFGFLSLLGDLVSSFIKRRMHRAEGDKMIGLDQVPEASLPLFVGAFLLDYGIMTIVIVTLLFFLLNLLMSPVIYLLGMAKHP